MLPLRYTRRWQVAGLLLLLSVLAATLVPAGWLWPDLPGPALFAADKWLHGLTFLFLAVWFSGQFSRQAFWRVGAGLFAFGILIELLQSTVPYRTAELMDVFADTAGIVAGLAIATAGAGGWSQRFEARFALRES
jgi:VanZ family protein